MSTVTSTDRLDARRPVVQAVAACPRCRARLALATSPVVCTGCGESFPDSAGVPVLLSEPGMAPPVRTHGRVVRLLRRLVPPVVVKSRASRHRARAFVASFPTSAVVLNIGAGGQRYGENVVNVDVYAAPSIDLCATGERLPIADESCDGVVVEAVLSVIPDGSAALREITRVLKPGGRVYLDVPFLQGYAYDPQDYRRLTETGLRSVIAEHGLRPLQSGLTAGPGSALAWVLREFLALALSFGSARLFRAVRLATRPLVAPIALTDLLLVRHPSAHVVASAFWLVAEKPAPAHREA